VQDDAKNKHGEGLMGLLVRDQCMDQSDEAKPDRVGAAVEREIAEMDALAGQHA
jgi:hypothetical protein